MLSANVISYIASTINTLSFLPQATLVIKTRNTKALSLGMWLISITATIFWTIFAFQIGNIGMIIADIIIFILTSIIIYFKIKNIIKGVDKL